LQHTLQPSLYMSQKDKQKKKQQEYKFQWLLPLHITFLSLTSSYTGANKTCMLWQWLITYDKFNPQKSDSFGHLVTWHTNNALVKSNSPPILNPTLTHSLMVSQNITYCCNNIHHQEQPVFHYTHHMLTAQLASVTH
jgi:hypothetical protein